METLNHAQSINQSIQVWLFQTWASCFTETARKSASTHLSIPSSCIYQRELSTIPKGMIITVFKWSHPAYRRHNCFGTRPVLKWKSVWMTQPKLPSLPFSFPFPPSLSDPESPIGEGTLRPLPVLFFLSHCIPLEIIHLYTELWGLGSSVSSANGVWSGAPVVIEFGAF